MECPEGFEPPCSIPLQALESKKATRPPFVEKLLMYKSFGGWYYIMSQTIHVWYIYLHLPYFTIKTTIHVGKYTSPMDLLGVEKTNAFWICWLTKRVAYVLRVAKSPKFPAWRRWAACQMKVPSISLGAVWGLGVISVCQMVGVEVDFFVQIIHRTICWDEMWKTFWFVFFVYFLRIRSTMGWKSPSCTTI